MRKSVPENIEPFRITAGPHASDDSFGMAGAFRIPSPEIGAMLLVMVHDGADWDVDKLGPLAWEHVSVSLKARTPTWKEMNFVKRLFWRDEEMVIQLHVPVKDHISIMENCLHLWNPIGLEIPTPPPIAV